MSKVIIGLGNFGGQYANTYHNLGFMVVDALAKRFNQLFDIDKCKSLIAKFEVDGEDVLIVKPKTYMNRSGIAVDEVMRKFKVKMKDIIIVVDDIDLDCGKIRFKVDGSAGTHNGLRNIVEVCKREDFKRLKMGVGRDAGVKLEDYVLSKIDFYKREIISKAVQEACNFLEHFIKDDEQIDFEKNVTFSV